MKNWTDYHKSLIEQIKEEEQQLQHYKKKLAYLRHKKKKAADRNQLL